MIRSFISYFSISYSNENSELYTTLTPCLQIHNCNKGEIFRSKVQSMYLEILQSPWLCELLAFYINLRRRASNHGTEAPWFFGDCSLSIDDGKPMLNYGLFDRVNLQIDLSCSICLVSSWYLIL